MHPLVLLVPAAALIFGPQIWVKRVLKQHNRKEQTGFLAGGELARELLARHHLHEVRVESSDIGDHYDPKAKAVRLTRDKIERKTLTAMTTAAHEVAHAIQDATNYGPFVWRMRLVTLAQKTGQVGTVILLSVPAITLFTRHTVPPIFVFATALAMLGTGMAAQLTALPTELNASFARAMPWLKDGYITERQAIDARKILVASSLTYVASSLLSVLNIWPWLGWWGPVPFTGQALQNHALRATSGTIVLERIAQDSRRANTRRGQPRRHHEKRICEDLVRRFGKPLIKSWLRFASCDSPRRYEKSPQKGTFLPNPSH